MLKQLRIQNFKIWEDTGKIGMAPLTLFFGANSSGKSSIGQFLMMLKQTTESQDRKSVFSPGGANSAVQLGSYQDMVFGHNLDNRIKFSYKWSMPDQLIIETPKPDAKTFQGDELRFFGSVDFSGKRAVVSQMRYTIFNDHDTSLLVNYKKRKDRNEYSLSADQIKLVRHRGRGWALKDTLQFYGFPKEVSSYYQNADFVRDLNLEHEKLFDSISYLGPLRAKASRVFFWNGDTPDSVGYIGEESIAAILAAADRKISYGPRQRAKKFHEVIANQLHKMGLVEEFKVRAISQSRRQYEVKVRTWGADEMVDLLDVGVGVAQVLPVLIQCFFAPANSIVIMEQPEIHLHPKAQAALADVMIDAINARENGKDRNIQLIVETHSEHFLRRLQRRIAEDSNLKQNQVAAYFADTSNPSAKLKTLELDKYGNILNWPNGFFGDEMGDIFAQAKTALTRRIADKEQNKEN